MRWIAGYVCFLFICTGIHITHMIYDRRIMLPILPHLDVKIACFAGCDEFLHVTTLKNPKTIWRDGLFRETPLSKNCSGHHVDIM